MTKRKQKLVDLGPDAHAVRYDGLFLGTCLLWTSAN